MGAEHKLVLVYKAHGRIVGDHQLEELVDGYIELFHRHPSHYSYDVSCFNIIDMLRVKVKEGKIDCSDVLVKISSNTYHFNDSGRFLLNMKYYNESDLDPIGDGILKRLLA